MSVSTKSRAVGAVWDDAWLLDGVRTPFADYNGPLAAVSPTDLGIKAARAVLDRAACAGGRRGHRITGNMTQSSFDAYMLPRHSALYSGVPIEVPAHMVQRVCGTGIEVLMQGADAVTHRDAGVALCVGTEIMSRNPVAVLHASRRLSAGPGGVQGFSVGGAAGPGAWAHHGRYGGGACATHQITRREVDEFAARSFDRALAAQRAFLDGEIVPVGNERSRGRGTPIAASRLAAQGGSVPATRTCGPRLSKRWRRCARRSAACRPRATARGWWTARRRGWCAPAPTRGAGAAPLARVGCRRCGGLRAGGHGHRPGAGDPCVAGTGGLGWMRSTGSRSMRRSAPR